jgi:hypothetical protein
MSFGAGLAGARELLAIKVSGLSGLSHETEEEAQRSLLAPLLNSQAVELVVQVPSQMA